MDLAFNKLQWLICLKTNQTKILYISSFTIKDKILTMYSVCNLEYKTNKKKKSTGSFTYFSFFSFFGI